MRSQIIFDKAIFSNNIHKIKQLMSHKAVNPAAYDNDAIIQASSRGYYDIVKLLLTDKRVDPSDDINSAIIEAKLNCHHNVVRLLWQNNIVPQTLKKQNPKKYNEIYKFIFKQKLCDF